MKQNQEHQKKIQDWIDEEEKQAPYRRRFSFGLKDSLDEHEKRFYDEEKKKAKKPAPSPLTASTASSPFSFGLKDDKPASTAASSAQPAFTFGKKPPAAPADAP